MFTVKPSEGERFFLRVLLLHVRGAQSFNDLYSVNGITYNTFRESCLALGLLEDDAEWNDTMHEASTFQMPWQLFGMILVYCDPSDPLELWNTFKSFMIEDFVKKGSSTSDAEQCALRHIEKVLKQAGKALITYNLPIVLVNFEDHSNAEISEGKVNESNVRKSEIKAESFTHPLAHKSPNIESSKTLYSFSRNIRS